MTVTHRTPTTEMEVTSIRLERELKERLKELSDHQGYQALIRDILWDYIHQHSDGEQRLDRSTIQATIPAVAQQEQRCALTGRVLHPLEPIFLGWTTQGEWVPLAQESWS